MTPNRLTSRRVFLMAVAATGATLTAGVQAQAPAAKPLIDEKDPQAVGLGYVHDAARVDTKKFPKYAAGQVCANCALYQGKPTDPAAGCVLFAGKNVAGKGWCSAWAKKA
ncbi:MAG: high-potential iron-sulfur protein [Pseudomonadota bacterium]